MSATQTDVLKEYQEDLEEAMRRGTLPDRSNFRTFLNLDLLLRLRVDYDLVVQQMLKSRLFPNLSGVQIEGRDDFLKSSPQSVGNQTGTHMVNFRLFYPESPASILDTEDLLKRTERRIATLGETLHFLRWNTVVWSRFPIVALQDFGEERAAVFFGSLSGGDARVIRFRPIDQKFRGCEYLIVTP